MHISGLSDLSVTFWMSPAMICLLFLKLLLLGNSSKTRCPILHKLNIFSSLAWSPRLHWVHNKLQKGFPEMTHGKHSFSAEAANLSRREITIPALIGNSWQGNMVQGLSKQVRLQGKKDWTLDLLSCIIQVIGCVWVTLYLNWKISFWGKEKSDFFYLNIAEAWESNSAYCELFQSWVNLC